MCQDIPSNPPEVEQQTAMSEMVDKNTEKADRSNDFDADSIASSEISTMETFDEYKLKIEQLLNSIGLGGFSIEAIQHGYSFINCVYALTSIHDPSEQYIVRVAINGDIRESDGKQQTLESDIAVLDYLQDKLPVPRIKAYSITADNVLNAAYTVQTRVPGESLNNLWSTMQYDDKYAIVDEFVALLAKLESVNFANADTFAPSTSLPVKRNDFSDTGNLLIHKFEPYAQGATRASESSKDRTDSNIRTLLIRHLESWIQEERDRDQHELSCSITPRFRKLQSMLEDMDGGGTFERQSSLTVLHHWDLEPRNLMVSKASGAWKIHGIIDWDDATALPKPLARIPPGWIWHFSDEDPDLEDGYLNDDQYADPELSDEDKALKAHFDTKIEALLPGYAEDAYGRGRWMRRIWFFAKEGAFRTWQWEFLDQLPKDWADRPKPKPRSSVLHWMRTTIEKARSAILNNRAS